MITLIKQGYTSRSLHYNQFIYKKIFQENSTGEIVLTQLDNYVRIGDISSFLTP